MIERHGIKPKRMTFCPGCRDNLKMPAAPAIEIKMVESKPDSKVVTLRQTMPVDMTGALF